MFVRIIKRWPLASLLILLHAVALGTITMLFYMSNDPEREFIWIYGFLVSYPSSLLLRLLRLGGLRLGDEPLLVATLLLAGTFQWGIIGAGVDFVIHRVRREATPNI